MTRLVFAGTPDFAATALEALLAAGHEISLVLTQPDRPAGRGQKLRPGPVKSLAESRGIPVAQPPRLKDEALAALLEQAPPEAMVVVAYGLILPPALLVWPEHGCLNIHASLLPRWRGAAPIQRAILAGDRETGVCIMRMEAGLDTGPVLLREALPIGEDESAGALHDRLAELGARLVVQALERLETLPEEPQDDALASYAEKIRKEEALIDWNRPAAEIGRKVRAFSPVPAARTLLGGELLKIHAAAPECGEGGPAGTVLAAAGDGIVVACGEGVLRITELQAAGGRRLPAADFLRGHALEPGSALGA